MNRGYIKLWRKSLESQVWQNAALWQLWCYCLLRANHKPCWVSAKTGRGSTQIYLGTGQFIFGSKQAAKDLKQKWQATYKRLMKLKNMQNLKTQSKTHFTIVTICNWEDYQNENNFDKTQSKTQVKTKGKPSKTDNNDNNDNNKKRYVSFFDSLWKRYPERNGLKRGKKEAFEFFLANFSPAQFPQLGAAVRNYAGCEDVQKGIGIVDMIRFLRPKRSGKKKLDAPWTEWAGNSTGCQDGEEQRKREALQEWKYFLSNNAGKTEAQRAELKASLGKKYSVDVGVFE